MKRTEKDLYRTIWKQAEEIEQLRKKLKEDVHEGGDVIQDD